MGYSSTLSHPLNMQQHTLLFLLLLLLLLSSTATAFSCLHDQYCGNGTLNVSYPFALDNHPGCSAFSDFFRLHCDALKSKVFINITTGNGYVNRNNVTFFLANVIPVEVTNITSDSIVIDANSLRVSMRYSSCSGGLSASAFIELPTFPGPFVISYDNQFGSFGCSTYGQFFLAQSHPQSGSPSTLAPAPAPAPASNDFDDQISITYKDYGGCFADTCQGDSGGTGKTCGTHKCCFSNLTQETGSGLHMAFFYSKALPTYNNTGCAHDLVGYSTFFHPNYTDLDKESYHLQLNWALPSIQTDNTTAIMQSSDYACSPNHSNIAIIPEVPGYRCQCTPGYMGDGYLNGSRCSDVDECNQTPDQYCVSTSHCHNSDGNYTCKCTGLFHVGDGRVNGTGCHYSNQLKLGLLISSAVVGLILIIGILVYIAIWWKQRTKNKYFMQNGGLEMQAFLGARPGRQMTRLFKTEELKAATNNYAEHMKIGTGGFGMVYKGVLNDGRLVAVKKAKNMASKDGADSRQFLNELAILTQINHRHIVRLLGCCLETEAPLLVYEYVSNGNVAESLEAKTTIMSWEQRLKVARQTAEALAYLHAAALPPIVHRDVKSTNVLLDHNLDSKVADFGLSRLVPEGVQQVSTNVQGTIGYLDPEYFHTLQLTDKSDVYSLGVLLTELITGLKPVDTRNREPRFANLASLFIHQMQEDKLDELIDARFNEVSSDVALRIHSSISAVATLACQCLALEGSMRPSMSEVADQLRHISRYLQAQGNESDEEAAPLLSSRNATVEYDAEPGVGVLIEAQSECLQSGSIDTMLLSSTNLAR